MSALLSTTLSLAGTELARVGLHLSGYNLPLGQSQAFRQWGSQTPGHP